MPLVCLKHDPFVPAQHTVGGMAYCGSCFDAALDFTIENQLTPKQVKDEIQDKLGKNMKGLAGAFGAITEAVKPMAEAFGKAGDAIVKAFGVPPPHYKMRCLKCGEDVKAVEEPWEGYAHVAGTCSGMMVDPMSEKHVEAYFIEVDTETAEFEKVVQDGLGLTDAQMKMSTDKAAIIAKENALSKEDADDLLKKMAVATGIPLKYVLPTAEDAEQVLEGAALHDAVNAYFQKGGDQLKVIKVATGELPPGQSMKGGFSIGGHGFISEEDGQAIIKKTVEQTEVKGWPVLIGDSGITPLPEPEVVLDDFQLTTVSLVDNPDPGCEIKIAPPKAADHIEFTVLSPPPEPNKNGDVFDPDAWGSAVQEFVVKHGSKVIQHPDGSKSIYGPLLGKEENEIAKAASLGTVAYKLAVKEYAAKRIDGAWYAPAAVPILPLEEIANALPPETTLKDIAPFVDSVSVAPKKDPVPGVYVEQMKGPVPSPLPTEIIVASSEEEADELSLADGGFGGLTGLELGYAVGKEGMDLILPDDDVDDDLNEY